MMNLENIRDRNILIVGLGKSGIAAVNAMLSLGARVSVQDSKKEEDMDGQLINYLKSRGVNCYLNRQPDLNEYFHMMILSPGVNPELDFVVERKNQGTEIIGELEIAYRLASGNFVAITGTNGKTTTTTLVGEIFKKAKRKTHVVGNIGVAVISKALETAEEDWLITETSSFQLQTTKYFKPVVSAILNLTPDHLNRHHTMEEYAEAKAMIWKNQDYSGYLVLNYDDEVLKELCINKIKPEPKAKIVYFSRKSPMELGAFVIGNDLVIKDEEGKVHHIIDKKDVKILGEHNVENILAAICICYFSGISPEVIGKGIAEFNGVEHRIEYVGEINGVKYYNDSKGTNVDASVTAINALGNNILLIAGGDGKGQDFLPLTESFKGRVKKLILLGRDKQIIESAARESGFEDIIWVKDMPSAVETAAKEAMQGDNVLLSPACASWDMYEDFQQRGNHFKDCVNRLAE